jgi:hypothetical protein
MRNAREAPRSTAMTPETEPGVQAAIVSAEGQPDREQAIRERAYAIWEQEGRPEGKLSNIGYALKRRSTPPRSSQKTKCHVIGRLIQIRQNAVLRARN